MKIQGHGCEKQGVQSRKVLCKILTGKGAGQQHLVFRYRANLLFAADVGFGHEPVDQNSAAAASVAAPAPAIARNLRDERELL